MSSPHSPFASLFRPSLAVTLLCLGVDFLAPVPVSADTLSNNINAPTEYTELISGSQWVAASFGTGNAAYTLSGITLLMQGDQGGSAALDLYSNVDGTPGVLLEKLQSPSTFPGALAPTVFTSTALPLLTDTTYWAVLAPVSGTSEWAYTDSNTGVGPGFQHAWALSNNAGAGWYTSDTQPMQMRVEADRTTATPEPSAASLLLASAAFALTLASRRSKRSL